MIAELWPFALALLAAGLFAGVLSGLLGVGGGIVIVPVLYHSFRLIGFPEDVLMHVAVGTSLATIIPTTIRTAMGHAKKGAVDFAVLKSWSPGIVLGVLAGALVADLVTGRVLMIVFAVMAMVFAINLSFLKETRTIGTDVPSKLGGTAIASVMGFFSTLMGIGGGTFGVTALTLFGMPIHRAVATAAGFGTVIAIPGTIGYIIGGWGQADLPAYSLGYVSLIGFALIVPATVLAAPVGVRLAHSLDRTVLRRIFAVFLALTSLRMFWDLLG